MSFQYHCTSSQIQTGIEILGFSLLLYQHLIVLDVAFGTEELDCSSITTCNCFFHVFICIWKRKFFTLATSDKLSFCSVTGIVLFGVPFVFLIEGPGLRIAGIYKYIYIVLFCFFPPYMALRKKLEIFMQIKNHHFSCWVCLLIFVLSWSRLIYFKDFFFLDIIFVWSCSTCLR